MTANHVATTNSVDARCQIIQWIVWKWADLTSGIRIRILRMFRAKRIAVAVMIALVLVTGLTSGVERVRMSRR